MKKPNATGFRITNENLDRLTEIELYIPTVSSRNAAMNFIIKSFHEVIIIPRSKKIVEIKNDMKAFGISIQDVR